MPLLPIIALILLLCILLYHTILHPLLLSPLSRIPGPKLYALTKWRLAYDELLGLRTQRIHHLHTLYGPVVRIGPDEIHCNSPTALKKVYGAGSGFERSRRFYRMFDVYGRANVFTFATTAEHGGRKKLLAAAYAKGRCVRGEVAREVEGFVEDFVRWVERGLEEGRKGEEIFRVLHFFSLDNITNFLYPAAYGGTRALRGVKEDQGLLGDILDPDRRRLSWFVVHFPGLVGWLYSRTGWMEGLVRPLLPMQKPATYTRIRAHALKAMEGYRDAVGRGEAKADADGKVIERLWCHHESVKKGGLDNLDIASECSDHFLAGIDTTSDTLMFLIWALSLPCNEKYQSRLAEEARRMPDESLNAFGNPTVEAADKLPYLDAVIKETLRLYAPLPASEPREPPSDTVVDGYAIPSRTIVSMSPYSLHRNESVFPEPLKFDPDRWINSSEERLTEMKRWWWAFSSGGRMCIGMHLAMSEMVALVPTVYRKFRTSIMPGFEGRAPGITSRFEVFSDETFERMEEHECWIRFERQASWKS